MPRGVVKEKTEMMGCLAALRRTLKHKDVHDISLELHEYWRGNEDALRRLCQEARTSVIQAFMEQKRSPLQFAKWWPYGDVSKAMLDGKLLMLRVEKGKEREWRERFEVIDLPEIRGMLSRKKFQNRKLETEYQEIYQDDVKMGHYVRGNE